MGEIKGRYGTKMNESSTFMMRFVKKMGMREIGAFHLKLVDFILVQIAMLE